MTSIFGVELKKFKKRVSLFSALFFVFGVSLYLVLFVPFWLSLIDLNTLGNTRRAITFGLDDDLFWMAVLILPAVVMSFSLLHYKSRETVYKAWLGYSALGLILFACTIVTYIIDPPGSAGVVSLDGIEFILLGLAYVAGSVLIWLYGAITHFFRKK
jgi:hypothetical protein